MLTHLGVARLQLAPLVVLLEDSDLLLQFPLLALEQGVMSLF